MTTITLPVWLFCIIALPAAAIAFMMMIVFTAIALELVKDPHNGSEI